MICLAAAGQSPLAATPSRPSPASRAMAISLNCVLACACALSSGNCGKVALADSEISLVDFSASPAAMAVLIMSALPLTSATTENELLVVECRHLQNPKE